MIRRPPRSTLFPTRRSSDLEGLPRGAQAGSFGRRPAGPARHRLLAEGREDRKSTRLNSSHTVISYAVFCLKKKTKSAPPITNSCVPTSLEKRTRTKLALLHA